MTLHLRFSLVIIALVIYAAAASGDDAASTDTTLLKMVQLELKRVGYDPGNTEGVLDKSTIVAITNFQASKGMEVTGQHSPQLVGILKAERGGASSAPATSSNNASSSTTHPSSNEGLSIAYLKGHWCTERTQERELYNFAADGSYRLGVLGLTITQFGGVNYFPETYSRPSFLDKFSTVARQDQNSFTVMLRSGRQETFLRGNCFL